VETDSYLEIRDCFIKSVKDKAVIDKEQEMLLADDQNPNIVSQIQDVEDCCFIMNIDSILPQT
jgi:hypothetical protein